MSNPVEAYAVPLKDEEELEGALLAEPLLAQALPVENDSGSATTGNAQLQSSRAGDGVAGVGSSGIREDARRHGNGACHYGSTQPGYAPSLPTESSAFSADSEKFRVFEGQANGLIAARQEREAIRTGMQRSRQQHLLAESATKHANYLARLRDQQGLQIRNDGRLQNEIQQRQQEAQASSQSAKSTSAQPNDNSEQGGSGGGYQIGEYKMGEYSTTEYSTSEYKSIYD